MTSYIESTLIKDEKVIYSGKVSIWSLMPLIIIGVLYVFTAFWIVSIVVWLIALIRYKTTELAFTNKRVIAKFGFIRRKTTELNLKKVESIQVNQSILGRMFNYGTLVISGTGSSHSPIPGISSPLNFHRAFMEFQDKAESDLTTS